MVSEIYKVLRNRDIAVYCNYCYHQLLLSRTLLLYQRISPLTFLSLN